MPNIGLERHEQKVLAKYLDIKGLLWCHVPNEGKRTLVGTVELKRQGLKAGVPDVLIFEAPPRKPDARGVAIELKRASNVIRVPKSRMILPSGAQWDWLQALRKQGWETAWCPGARDAIEWLQGMGW